MSEYSPESGRSKMDGVHALSRRSILRKFASLGLGATVLAGIGEVVGGVGVASADTVCSGQTFTLSEGQCGGPCPSGYYCYYDPSCLVLPTGHSCCKSSGQETIKGCTRP